MEDCQLGTEKRQMPLRPIEHQLESLSFAALSSLVPQTWVVRRNSDDYGIDGEIEIFDETGLATGTTFKFQLKSTRQKITRNKLQVTLKRTTINYFRARREPVLICCYHEPSDEMYVRWFHSNPHSAKEASTVRISFSIYSQWKEDTPLSLIHSLGEYRNIRANNPEWPVLLGVGVGNQLDFSTPTIRLALQAVARDLRHVLRVKWAAEGDSQYHPNRLALNGPEISVVLAEMPIANIKYELKRSWTPTSKSVASDMLTLVGIGLKRLGHHNVACDVFRQTLATSSLLRKLEVTIEVADTFRRAGRPIEAIELAESLSTTDSDLEVVQNILLSFHSSRSRLSRTDIQSVIVRLKAILYRFRTEATPQMIAACWYSIGNVARTGGLGREALKCYSLARRFDSSYMDREYFLREIAGACFVSARYRFAIRFYRRAIEHDGNASTRFLFADALIMGGAYAEATAIVSDIVGELPVSRQADCLVTRWVLEHFREIGVPAYQERNQIAHEQGTARQPEDPVEVIRISHKTLKADPLLPDVWFNCGVAQAQISYDLATMSFLCAAYLAPSDVEAWANCLACAMHNEDMTTFSIVLAVGLKKHPSRLIERLLEMASPEVAPRLGKFLAEILETNLLNEMEQSEGISIRLFGTSKPGQV